MDTEGQKLAVSLIESLEGYKLEAYPDSSNPPVPTIGYGTTKYPSGAAVKLGDKITPAQATECLQYHLNHYVFPQLQLRTSIPPRIYAALSSLAYNVGTLEETIKTVVWLNKWENLPYHFRLYNKVNGKVCQGLVNRREKEIAFMKDEL